ncbi:MAG: hypothetical protein QOD91_754, partial [Frankiales bacterium]|nr:hypothetical protein [Frankiales bacterium]
MEYAALTAEADEATFAPDSSWHRGSRFTAAQILAGVESRRTSAARRLVRDDRVALGE